MRDTLPALLGIYRYVSSVLQGRNGPPATGTHKQNTHSSKNEQRMMKVRAVWNDQSVTGNNGYYQYRFSSVTTVVNWLVFLCMSGVLDLDKIKQKCNT